tara:strand:+ start:2332 stop:2619 length:288 start_codon:yes stop_codon:yes gene_type:complete
MITKDDEYFDDRWWECLEVIEASKEIMHEELEDEWEEEARAKWIAKSSDDCLMGKYKKWSEIRKVLWDHYVSEEKRAKWVEVFGKEGWESDDEGV